MRKNLLTVAKDTKVYTLEELQGRPHKTVWVVIATLGLLTIALGTMLPIFSVQLGLLTLVWWKYVFAAGALLYLVGKLFCPYTGTHPRIKRLYRIEAWSAVFFCVAAFFFFWQPYQTRDAFAFTLAGGFLLIFTTIAIPRTVRKVLRDQAADADGKSKSKKG